MALLAIRIFFLNSDLATSSSVARWYCCSCAWRAVGSCFAPAHIVTRSFLGAQLTDC
jgi:hypothetical protein